MNKFRIESIILAIGLFLLGLCIYWGLNSVAERDRVVSVRGLAEREVVANQVIWPIVYNVTGDDLNALYKEMNTKNKRISDFLTQNGIKKEEVAINAPEIDDKLADRYNSDWKGYRYNIKVTLTVATEQVEKVRTLIPRMGELLPEGIAISRGNWETRVQYEFTDLNKIKPEMIEEATRNARAAAEKFATDSESNLGKIQSATQGLFSISDRDKYTPHIKKIRVVTSVNYFLES